MKFTPNDIRQHTFEKGLRGYRTEDVDAFLVAISEEWEHVTSDYKMLKMQLELAEKELGKLKEVEMTLFRTLKTAEDTSAQITDQANKAGEKYISEAKQKADSLLAEARKNSTLMVQDAENKARYLKDTILNDLKSLENDFKALENYKENLATQIRTLAGNAVDSVTRFEKKFVKQNLKGKIDEAASQLEKELEQTNEIESLEKEAITNQLPAVELPPLEQRETTIPEAIPVDEQVVEKLDEAIEHVTHPVKVVEEPIADTEPQIIQENSSTKITDPKTEPEPISDVPSEKPEQPKGGSFFDQI